MDKKVVVILVLVLAIAGAYYWYSTSTTSKTATNTAPQQQQTQTPTNTATTNTTTAKLPELPSKGPFAVMVGANGEYLGDKNGLTLYVDIKDEGQKGKVKASCDATCEKTWLPYIVDKSDYGAISTTTALFSKINVIDRTDGKQQYALGTKPLYRYVGDTKPTDIKGPVTGDWMVAALVLKKP
jgi:predicted lipoprotein with Yx(FWY)xxD motif